VSEWGKTRRILQTTLILTGIYVAGYPLERPEWAAWSRNLMWVGDYIFPLGTDYPRRWTALGWDLAVTGIWLSPSLQTIFSNKMFMWIGRNSFAVYLTHGTVLRVFAARLIYGWSTDGFSVEKVENGDDIKHFIPRGGRMAFVVGIPIFFIVEYTIAHFWTTYVDAWCAKATKWLEDTMFESEDEKSAMQYA
jgi:peptidoglycan/LPS O-acetylase OafA/YrhL